MFSKGETFVYCGKRMMDPMNQDALQFVTIEKAFAADDGDALYLVSAPNFGQFLVPPSDLQPPPTERFFGWKGNVMIRAEQGAQIFCHLYRDDLAANLAALLNREPDKWAADFAEQPRK